MTMPRDRDVDYYVDDDDRPRPRRGSGGGGIDALIPYRNGMALAAYYCGVFGLIPCVCGLGIVGVVPVTLGILGLKRANEDPPARGTAHAWTGIILGAIEI